MGLAFVLVLIIVVLIGTNIWVWQANRNVSPLAVRQDTADLTRQNAEHKLAVERNMLITLIDTLPDAVFMTDLDGKYTLSNKAHYLALGATSMEEVVGKMPSDFFSEDAAAQYAQEDQTVFTTRKPLHLETPNVRASNQLNWINLTKVPLLTPQGDLLGLVGVIRDVTLVKQAQDDLQSRISQMRLLGEIDTEVNSTLDIRRVATTALDIAMRLSTADAGFIAVLEDEEMRVMVALGTYSQTMVGEVISHKTGITGRVLVEQEPQLILDVLTDPDYRKDIPNIKALMVLPLVSQDRLVGIISLETSRAHRFTENVFQFVQLVAGRVAVAVDNARLYELVNAKLRETENLYKETELLYHEMTQLEQLKTDMIRIASHDLKNPLAIMQGYMSMLRLNGDNFDDETRDYLHEIERANHRMSQILEDILSLERIQERAKQNFVHFDLSTQVLHAYDEFLPQAHQKNQTLTLHYDAQVSLMVDGDATQIYEAITNIIGNAIKYTPNGGTVDVFLQKGDPNNAVFKTQDSGYGIPAEMQAQLFQPFYRAKTDETRQIEGTGLGLHLVKNIVERHHGLMVFHSEYGKGSLFGFELPLVGNI